MEGAAGDGGGEGHWNGGGGWWGDREGKYRLTAAGRGGAQRRVDTEVVY